MKLNYIKLWILCLLLLTIIQANADIPDPYQNSNHNNIAYDLSTKWYVGANTGYSIFNDNIAAANKNSIGLGLFSGYKFNKYFFLETNLQRFAKIKTIYNLSLDGLINLPIITTYQYTLSFYGKGGYGMNFAEYHYNNRHNVTLNHGAYNVGLGMNVDFRNNFSARIEYTYYQVYYPSLTTNGKHNVNNFTLGIYYNFA